MASASSLSVIIDMCTEGITNKGILNTGPELASKLTVMSQIRLVI